MDRVYLSRGARGMLVTDVQQNLQRDGYYTGNIDGSYGGVTEKGVANFQDEHQLAISGAIDTTTWVDLMRRPVPSLYERCLEVTAAFEGHGFSAVAGAWDAGWLTWGIIGFTLASGSLKHVVLDVWEKAPEVVRQSFGSRTEELINIMGASPADQKAWAQSISVPPKMYRVVDPWRTAFMAFGQSPVVQARQLQRAEEDYFQPAMQLMSRLALQQELGAGLCFDIQVQNGGLKQSAEETVDEFRQNNPSASEEDLRRIIADAVADSSDPQYREDVRARKETFATGIGTVHGSDVNLKQWGLDAVPIAGA